MNVKSCVIFRLPPYSLTCEIHYEKLMEMFGKKGHYCTTVQEIEQALKDALSVSISLLTKYLNYIRLRYIIHIHGH